MPSLDQVNGIAQGAASAWSFAGDFAIVIAVMAVLFMFAWYVGRGPFIGLLISFYVGYALYALFPYASYLPTAPPLTAFLCDLGLYAVLAGVVYTILRRTVASDFIWIGPVGLLILALLGTGFIFALLYQVFPTREVYAFTPILNTLFAPKEYFFWWFVAPLVGLFFLAK